MKTSTEKKRKSALRPSASPSSSSVLDSLIHTLACVYSGLSDSFAIFPALIAIYRCARVRKIPLATVAVLTGLLPKLPHDPGPFLQMHSTQRHHLPGKHQFVRLCRFACYPNHYGLGSVVPEHHHNERIRRVVLEHSIPCMLLPLTFCSPTRTLISIPSILRFAGYIPSIYCPFC